VDEDLITPADFTIALKNIPMGLKDVDYHFEIKNIMENYACLNLSSD